MNAERRNALALALAAMIWPTVTCAQVAAYPDLFEIFSRPFGDLATSSLLNQIFGPLFPVPGNIVASTAFSTLIGIVNSAVLVLAAALFLYNMSVAVLQSAHEGVVLGRRWSSLWAPLRVIVAVAMLIPVPGLGGYNSIQAAVAWTVRGSTALATAIWSQGAESLATGDVVLSGHASELDPGLLRTAFRNRLCMRIMNYQLAATQYPLRVEFTSSESGRSQSLVSKIGTGRAGICGSFTLPETPDSVPQALFRAAHQSLLEDLIQGVDRLIDRVWAAAIGQENLPDLSADLRELTLRSARLRSDAREMLTRSMYADGEAERRIQDFLSGSNCRISVGGHPCPVGGWIGAGSWYMTLAHLNSRSIAASGASITAREPILDLSVTGRNSSDLAMWSGPGGLVSTGQRLNEREARQIWQAAEGAMESAAKRLAADGFPLGGDAFAEPGSDSRSGLMARIWNAAYRAGVDAAIDRMSPSNWDVDPMIGIVAMGHWFLDVAATLLFGSVAVSFASGALANAVTFLIAAPMIAIGTTLSFVLPMLPFFYWIFAIGTYFLLVVEAIVASSLWALAHMRLDGEGISGPEGRRGWLTLLALTLTPTLMILGLFTAMILFRIITWLLEAGARQALAALTVASPIVAVFGMIAAGALLVAVYLIVVERSFSLVSEFPSQVLGWLGTSVNLSGEDARIRASGANIASAMGSGTAQVSKFAAKRSGPSA